MVGAEGVPGEEAREVLDCAEGLVAADWVVLAGCCVGVVCGGCVEASVFLLLTGCCDKLLVVGDGRVVDKGVGDHGGRLAMSIV